MNGLSPAEWRVLISTYKAAQTAVAANARKVCDNQDANRDHLVNLEAHDLIHAVVRGVEVALEQVAGHARHLDSVTLTITSRGRRKVETDPLCRVVTALVRVANRASVTYLRSHADAKDTVLREMESAGLVAAYGTDGGADVPLATFRKIPGQLFIRLTKKGRRYYPLPSRDWFPGQAPHEVAGADPHD